MDSVTDKKRLSQVQTQDLTESRLNDDFVFWLKKHGMNTLLVILIAACAILGWNYWQRKQTEKTATAWSDIMSATLPEALEQAAKDHAEVPQASMMALLRAGDLRLAQLQSGMLEPEIRDGSGTVTTPAKPLDEAARKIAQDAADEDYTKAAEVAVKLAGGDKSKAVLVVVQSLFGRAAIAESRGDLESAKRLLGEAETLSGKDWAPIAKLAKTRIDGLVALSEPFTLPRNADLPVEAPAAPAAGAGGASDLYSNILNEQGQPQAPATDSQSQPKPQLVPAPAPTPTPAPGG